MNIERYIYYNLNKQSKSLMFTLAVMMIIVLGIIDYWLVWEIDLLIFYLIPIFLVIWFVGRNAGIALSVIGSAVWFIADVKSRHSYAHPAIPYWNMFVILSFFLILCYILAALRNALEYQKELARTDFLTGAINRRYFYELANMEINKMKRSNKPLTIVYLDVDNFKYINDSMGHTIGDNLLKLVVKKIKENVREIDIVARLGGDEFAVLLPETEDNAAGTVVARIQKYLLEQMQKNKWPVTFSIGVATFHRPPQSADVMVKEADSLMYKVKNSGKNKLQQKVFSA